LLFGVAKRGGEKEGPPSAWSAKLKKGHALDTARDRSDIEAFVEISGLFHLPDDFLVLSLFVGIRFLDSCEFLLQDVLDIGSQGDETTGTGRLPRLVPTNLR